MKKILGTILAILLPAMIVYGGYNAITGSDTVNNALLNKVNPNFVELYNYLTGTTSPTLLTPTIANLTNAQHDHNSVSGGGVSGAPVDYSSTSTLTGWSSTTTKQVWYTKVGRLVYVSYSISGTSNTTSSSGFTLPYSVTAGSGAAGLTFPCFVMDNGNYQTFPGRMTCAGTSCGARMDWSLVPPWTGSGTKAVQGALWYFTDS